MTFVSINPDLCHKDGICAGVCPTKYILSKEGEVPEPRNNSDAACIECGQCIAFCPHDAVRVDTLSAQAAPVIQRESLPTPGAVESLMRSRRSIRLYKDTPVPQETVYSLIDTASSAPTAKNRRAIRYVVVYDAVSMQQFGDCIATCMEEDAARNKTPGIPNAKSLAHSWRTGADGIFRGAPHLAAAVAPQDWMWNITDSAISLTYLELIAHAHGIGMCWAGYVTTAAQLYAPVRDFLGIAADEIMCGGQMFGYPLIRPRRAAPRKSYDLNLL